MRLLSPPEDTLIRSRNAIYLEAGGNGGYGSINYDRILRQNRRFKLSGHIGAGFTYKESFDKATPLIPVEVDVLIGEYKNFMELGLGYTAGWAYQRYQSAEATNGTRAQYALRKEFVTYGFARLGYRYQPSQSGWLFRLGFTPIFLKTGQSVHGFGLSLWGGLSLGRTF